MNSILLHQRKSAAVWTNAVTEKIMSHVTNLGNQVIGAQQARFSLWLLPKPRAFHLKWNLLRCIRASDGRNICGAEKGLVEQINKASEKNKIFKANDYLLY